MPRRIFALAAVIAAAVVLSTAISATSGSAAPVGRPPGLAGRQGDLMHRTAVVCGYWGCAPRARVWHYRARHWGPWGYAVRPACPLGYYYACRRGPLG
jgi:hypothetical protein